MRGLGCDVLNIEVNVLVVKLLSLKGFIKWMCSERTINFGGWSKELYSNVKGDGW